MHFRGVAKYVCKLIRIVQPIVACIGEKGSTTRGRAPHGRESKSFDRDPHRFETVRSRQARDEQSDRHLIEQERLVGCRGPFTSGPLLDGGAPSPPDLGSNAIRAASQVDAIGTLPYSNDQMHTARAVHRLIESGGIERSRCRGVRGKVA
ncbi:pantoate--beta-alanine ligase [Bradyrhizobium barranii]|uniref:pantoate--beta-alanine ligase n=1 Tax=Bradyrhizobium barranii TaxID=2992140 RepID=UPI003CCAAB82